MKTARPARIRRSPRRPAVRIVFGPKFLYSVFEWKPKSVLAPVGRPAGSRKSVR